MPSFVSVGFASVDAGQGGGAVDVSAKIQYQDPIFQDTRAGVPFNPWGAARMANYPGRIQAAALPYMYQPADTSEQNYEDTIASWDDQTQMTHVIRRAAGAASTTIHQLTVTGREANGPSGGLFAGQPVRYPGNMMIDQVVHYDGTTTYTW